MLKKSNETETQITKEAQKTATKQKERKEKNKIERNIEAWKCKYQQLTQ